MDGLKIRELVFSPAPPAEDSLVLCCCHAAAEEPKRLVWFHIPSGAYFQHHQDGAGMAYHQVVCKKCYRDWDGISDFAERIHDARIWAQGSLLSRAESESLAHVFEGEAQ